MNRLTMLGLLLTGFLLVGVSSCSKPPGQAEYDRGLYELKRGNAVRAKALLEKSITRRPGAEENALAYNYLGVAAGKLGQFQAAQEAFEDSRRLGPTLAEPVLNLGLLSVSSGDQLRALKWFEEAARLDEKDTRALEHMAELYRTRQQWPEARRMLYAALNRAPDTPRLLTALANIDLAAKGDQAAMETLLRALEHNARYAPALFNLAYIYDSRLNDPVHARSYYRRFLGISGSGPQADFARRALKRIESTVPPRPPPDLDAEPAPPPGPPPAEGTAVPSAVVEVPSAPAVVTPPVPPALAEDSQQGAVRRAAQLVERGETPAALTLLLEAADKARRENRTADELKLVQDAARLCFDEPRAHYELGRLLLARNDADDALKSFKKATTLDRNYAPAHLALARTARQTGEYDAAVVGYQAAIKADARDPEPVWELAQLLDNQLKNTERALETYRDFERLFPRDPRVLQAADRAKSLAAQRPVVAPVATVSPPPVTPRPVVVAPPVVVPTSQATVITFPSTPERSARPTRQISYQPPVTPNPRAALLAFNQGAQFQQQGKWDSAIYYYLRSLENDDRLGTTFYNLGSAYAARGETELARDAYLRALQLQPDLVSARYNLALLYLQASEWASAESLLREVVRQKPDYAAAHYTLGMIYARTPATLDQARQSYRRYLQLAPNEPTAAVVRKWLTEH
jgi:tetratricopeptide (TPR) repeat protein